MEERYYTHALWKVKPGKQEEFIAAWKGLGAVFSQMKGVGNGTLLQNLSNPTEFYSFGPWDGLEDIQAMRANPQAQAAIRNVMELCEEAEPGSYRVAAEVRS